MRVPRSVLQARRREVWEDWSDDASCAGAKACSGMDRVSEGQPFKSSMNILCCEEGSGKSGTKVKLSFVVK